MEQTSIENIEQSYEFLPDLHRLAWSALRSYQDAGKETCITGYFDCLEWPRIVRPQPLTNRRCL